jgi:Ala-tRNA(Pro) deacylase
MLKAHLNITPGSVSLFNMIYAKDVELVIDKAVWDAEITGFHPNENTSTLEITKEGLEKFYNSLRGKKRIVHLG